MNPELFTLSLIEWQLFATLTFRSDKLADAVRIKMFFALMREQAGLLEDKLCPDAKQIYTRVPRQMLVRAEGVGPIAAD